MNDSADKINHLNLALRAIRSINRLIVRTRERDPLLTGICDILIKNRGYAKVWLAAFNAAGNIDTWAESDRQTGSLLFEEKFEAGSMIYCAQQALDEDGTVLVLNPSVSCVDCPLADKHEGWAAMTTPLKHNGTVYGLMSVSIPGELISEEIERTLVEEIAGDIAYGLYRIQCDEVHKKADKDLESRIRELNCLYHYSAIVDTPDISLEQILDETVYLLPAAMQASDSTCAAITLDEQRFETRNYRKTEKEICQRIQVNQRPAGWIAVGCLNNSCIASHANPFSRDEEKLVRSIAERLGKTVERKRGRKDLEDSEKRFRDLVENAFTCISIIQNDRIVYRNPGYSRRFGTSNDSLILPDYSIRNIHPDDDNDVRSAIEPFFTGGMPAVDMAFRICDDHQSNAVADVKWFHGRLNMIEYQGKPAVLFYLMDVSRIKELEQLLKIQDKMTSLGRVAAGIAHEIRNPLSGINIYIKALESSCERGENQDKINAILSQIQSASNKIESVIKRVMDFSRPGEPNFDIISPNLPVEEAVQLSEVTLRKSGIAITLDLCPDIPACRADQHMIEQVILNLISNAADAMKSIVGEKHIHLSTFIEEDGICIRVCDSGPGVPAKVADNIFDPFYTTKKNNSGIGLSICHRIIRDHNGSLEVMTGHLNGAEFCIKLPFAAQDTP